MKAARQRFEAKFYITPGCWIWTACTVKGYGSIKINGKMVKAHRYSFEVYYEKPPHNLLVCHSCDNPLCVNPDHLFLGTYADNTSDMMRKGRHKVASHENRKHIIRIDTGTIEKIRELLAAGKSTRDIAKRVGVANSHVWNIGKGNKRMVC